MNCKTCYICNTKARPDLRTITFKSKTDGSFDHLLCLDCMGKLLEFFIDNTEAKLTAALLRLVRSFV